jgi:hypothetical protein
MGKGTRPISRAGSHFSAGCSEDKQKERPGRDFRADNPQSLSQFIIHTSCPLSVLRASAPLRDLSPPLLSVAISDNGCSTAHHPRSLPVSCPLPRLKPEPCFSFILQHSSFIISKTPPPDRKFPTITFPQKFSPFSQIFVFCKSVQNMHLRRPFVAPPKRFSRKFLTKCTCVCYTKANPGQASLISL